jgi:hypothetical protein
MTDRDSLQKRIKTTVVGVKYEEPNPDEPEVQALPKPGTSNLSLALLARSQLYSRLANYCFDIENLMQKEAEKSIWAANPPQTMRSLKHDAQSFVNNDAVKTLFETKKALLVAKEIEYTRLMENWIKVRKKIDQIQDSIVANDKTVVDLQETLSKREKELIDLLKKKDELSDGFKSPVDKLKHLLEAEKQKCREEHANSIRVLRGEVEREKTKLETKATHHAEVVYVDIVDELKKIESEKVLSCTGYLPHSVAFSTPDYYFGFAENIHNSTQEGMSTKERLQQNDLYFTDTSFFQKYIKPCLHHLIADRHDFVYQIGSSASSVSLDNKNFPLGAFIELVIVNVGLIEEDIKAATERLQKMPVPEKSDKDAHNVIKALKEKLA